MILRLRPVAAPKLCYLTAEQLAEAAANLVIEFDCNVRPVTFAENPPPDTTLPWQQTDGCGGAPLGRLKFFTNGEWK